ncbi:hypothetical protein [Parvicella tangerina]|uniref:Uncharacterized protein n=1 Tax=Parvicella tangerina TaxID=2829795 RepID=A0A916NEV9_9FLAO|nr:hypothetical protein [Parvicella tangerina]CAG5087649.1 hypothetical protein CRYO30217_03536 [Parvicella tangerina]
MKEIITILTLLFTLFLGSGFAQSPDIDDRLLVQFSQEELETMDKQELAFHTYCIENAFQVMPFPKEKAGDAAINGARNIKDLSTINFFELNITLKQDEYQYFTLLGTDKMLMIKPITLIKQEL